MELYNIYCGFWEGMKEISVEGVPKWIYIVGNLKKKEIVDCSKRPSEKEKEKKNGREQKQKKKKWWKRKKIEVQFELYYVKLVELMIFEKKKLCSTSL